MPSQPKFRKRWLSVRMLKLFVDKLREDMGLHDPIVPNDDGSYDLHFEPNLHVSLRENLDSGISLFTLVALLPEKKERFLLKAMIANLFGRETGGAMLGLDKEGKRMTFLSFLPLKLDYRDFHDYLEDFVNYTEAWRGEITEID